MKELNGRMTKHVTPQTATFTGANGNTLVSDVFGDTRPGVMGPPVMLLHGGGQTRHAWRATAAGLARRGFTAYAIDQRGHGDSEWVADGGYLFPNFASDVKAVAAELAREHGARPAAIGASMGGIASMLAEGETFRDSGDHILSSLVLVDITPRVDYEGVDKVQGFMRAHAREGFATIEEAADAVAEYLPHRPRPKSTEGLKKNLRLGPDGRWRWHWDPRFMDGRKSFDPDRKRLEESMLDAARSVRVPALLVRGGSSELVQEAHVKEFLDLVPHAEYVDVAGARHMVAGDANDNFASAVIDFLTRTRDAHAAPAR
jgi:pimeloyl-ACP methyl ester carboxylesterase